MKSVFVYTIFFSAFAANFLMKKSIWMISLAERSEIKELIIVIWFRIDIDDFIKKCLWKLLVKGTTADFWYELHLLALDWRTRDPEKWYASSDTILFLQLKIMGLERCHANEKIYANILSGRERDWTIENQLFYRSLTGHNLITLTSPRCGSILQREKRTCNSLQMKLASLIAQPSYFIYANSSWRRWWDLCL